MREVYKLTMILKKYFPISFARITLIAQMVLALIKVRTVCLSEVATGFAGKAEAASDEKRRSEISERFSLRQRSDCAIYSIRTP